MEGRRLIAWLMLVVLLLAGCGGGEPEGTPEAPAALAYVPPDASLVVIVPTDLEGSQLTRLERLIAPELRDAGSASLRDVLDSAAKDVQLDYQRDVAPLLGAPLVAALSESFDDGGAFLALETPDGERLQRVLEAFDLERTGEHRGALLYDEGAAVDGDTLLVSLSGDLRAAIDRRRDGGGMQAAAMGALEGAPEERLVTGFATTGGLAQIDPALRAAAGLPWLQAARDYGFWLSLEEDAVRGGARVRTEPGELSDDDLPLAAGEEAPEVPRADGAYAGGNRNQSRTTVFLAQLARRAFPDSDFVREVEAIERDLGVTFEEEVLSQFDGPSASLARPGGEFSAVSDLSDPDRMRELLPRLAPRLPGVLQGLRGLGSGGLLALLLFAPDAPLVPGALPLLQGAIEVVPLGGGGGEEQLYRITGLDDPEAEGTPLAVGEVVFGLIGDRFVVASSEDGAREAASMEVEAVDGARGAAVGRADLSTFEAEGLRDAVGLKTVPLGELVTELEASTERLEGRLRIEVPGGLGG